MISIAMTSDILGDPGRREMRANFAAGTSSPLNIAEKRLRMRQTASYAAKIPCPRRTFPPANLVFLASCEWTYNSSY